MNCLRVSKRLSLIATFLPKGTFFADIGTDHAYLACYVCSNDNQAKAIASDVNRGPYASAKNTVKSYNLEQRIDVRLGDGLSVLADEPITDLVIAGMGGALIKSILESGKNKIRTVERIIAQPNIGEIHVRSWLMNNGFSMTNEIILEENEKIYEIIVADRNMKRNERALLTDKELYFGPKLLEEKSAVFKRKWTLRKEKVMNVLRQLKQGKTINKQKINEFRKELLWIEEVLQDE